MTHIAVQLYSLRDLMGEDQRDATFSQLGDWGLTEVEAADKAGFSTVGE